MITSWKLVACQALLLSGACHSGPDQDTGIVLDTSDSTQLPPDTTGPSSPPESVLCDGGSGEVRLRFAYFDGETPFASEPMMAKQGNRYLVVDGLCKFYIYDDGQHPLYQWTPVMTGVLSEDDVAEIIEELDLSTWASSSSESLEAPPGYTYHLGRVTFFLNGVSAECHNCNDIGLDLMGRALGAIERLYPLATPYEAATLEALVFTPLSSGETPGWSVEWSAASQPETFLGERGLDPTADLGVVVTDEDRAWFAEVQAGFQARDLILYPRQQDGIDVVEDLGASTTADWELYVRSIVP